MHKSVCVTDGHIERVLGSKDVAASLVRYREGQSTPWHAHERLVLTLTISGNLRSEWPTRSSDAGYGNLRVIPPSTVHRVHFNSDTRCFVLALETDAPKGQRAHMRGGLSEVALLTRRACREFRLNDDFSADSLQTYGHCLARELERQSRCRIPRWLIRVRDLLESAPARPLTLDAIATESGVSPRTVSRRFFAHFGCSPAEYQRSRRVALALQLLKEGELRASEVAAHAGFVDQSHMSKGFRALLGVTPGQASSKRPQ